MNRKKIARERINKLFNLAKKKCFREEYEKCKRYIYLAREIAMSHNISISKYKRFFCKNCNVYYTSKTARIRNQKNKLLTTYTCKLCGSIQRYPYVKEKLKKRKF